MILHREKERDRETEAETQAEEDQARHSHRGTQQDRDGLELPEDMSSMPGLRC